MKENAKSMVNTIVTSDMAKGVLDIGVGVTDGLKFLVDSLNEGYSSLVRGNLGKDLGNAIFTGLEHLNVGNRVQGFVSDIMKNFQSSVGDILTNTKLGDVFGKIFDTTNFGDKFNSKMGEVIKGFNNSDFANRFNSTVSDIIEKAFNTTKVGKANKLFDKLFGDYFEGKELEQSIASRKDNINAITAEVASLRNQQKVIKDILPEYDALNKKTNRTAEETQKLANIRNQIAESNPESVLGYDNKGNAIIQDPKLYNKQLETQIQLKLQSQRLDENALASSTLAQRTKNQKEYNKQLKESQNLQLASTTQRKEGLFGKKENLQDYANRIVKENEKISESNAKTYEEGIKRHQQYMADEKAIQEKYINQMESNPAFNKMAEKTQASMLSFMDALDWSNFSEAQGQSFTNQLAKISDKVVGTTAEMGKQSKAIQTLTNDYANGKMNLTEFTKGLTEQYETAGKFDAESFTAWRSGLQAYIDSTGDLAGANREIERMATSLSKVTGIDKSTWKTALSFDPAPIDASNQALQRFLNSYGTGVQNLGKGGMADKLQSQFQNLQTSFGQLTKDMQKPEKIDKEYLMNFKLNQPEPIQNLIDKLVSDGVDPEVDLPILINAIVDLLNGGEITDETISKIADLFGMSEADVRVMLNAKVEGDFSEVEQYIQEWDGISDEEKQLLLRMLEEGGDKVKTALQNWDSLSNEEKQQVLRQLLEKNGDVEEENKKFENAKEGTKEQKLNQGVNKEGNINEANNEFEKTKEGTKTQTLNQEANDNGVSDGVSKWEQVHNDEKQLKLQMDVDGDGKVDRANNKLNEIDGKTATANAKVDGDASGADKVNNAVNEVNGKEGTATVKVEGDTSGADKVNSAVEGIPSVKEVMISVVQSGTNLLDSITNWINSKAKQNVNVSVEVSGKEQIDSIKSSIDGIEGDISVNFSTNASTVSEQITSLKSASQGVSGDTKSINFSTNASSIVGQINSLKSASQGVIGGTKSINFTTNAGGVVGQINALKSASQGMPSGKTITFTSNASGIAGQVRSLSSAVSGVPGGKSITYSTNASSVAGKVRSLAGAVSSVPGGKSINFTVTTTYRTVGSPTSVSAGAGRISSVNTPRLVNMPINPNGGFSASSINNPTPIGTMGLTSATPINSFVSVPSNLNTNNNISEVGTRATSNNGITQSTPISMSSYIKSIDAGIELLEEFYARVDKINNAIELTDEYMENAFGKNKIQYLEQQNELYSEQVGLQEELLDKLLNEKSLLTDKLINIGFKFNDDGNLTNYEEKILAMQNEYDRLDKLAEEASKKSQDYEGKNETTKKKLSKASEDARKKADDYNKTLQDAKKYSSEYFDLINTEIPKAEKEWANLNNEQDKNLATIRKINREAKELNLTGAYTNIISGRDKAQNDLDILDSMIEITNNEKERNELLQQRIDLISKLKKETQEELDFYVQMQKEIGNELSKYGFVIDGRDIKNFRTQMNELKDSLPEDEFEYVENLTDSFLDMVTDKIPGVAVELNKLDKEVKNINEDLKELTREKWKINIEGVYTNVSSGVEKAKNDLDILDSKIDLSNDLEKNELLKERIILIENLKKETQEELEFYEKMQGEIGDELSKYGFIVDGRDIKNFRTQMNELKDSLPEDEYKHVEAIADAFLDLATDKIPNTTIELNKFDKEIQDTLKDQLSITQKIEKQITEIYENELEERKKAMEKATKEKIDALKKEQQAYKDMREEADYQDEISDQQKVIDNINKQIELAKRDTSLAGKKKLEELLKQLDEENKKFQKITQDKIDDTINNAYESEIDRLEDENNKAIEDLENTWTDSKIADAVKEALQTGVFTSITGEVINLQDALIQYAEKSGDAFGVLGQTVKNELVSNLQTALETLKNIDSINSQLGLENYQATNITNSNMMHVPETTSNAKTIVVNSTPSFVINANDDIDYDEIQNMIDESNEKLIEEILKN